MNTLESSQPSFLNRAKRVNNSPSFEKERPSPSFLNRAKQVSEPKYPFEGENDLDREIERNIARSTSRGIEAIAGLPGDIQSVISGITGHEFETEFPSSSNLQQKAEKFGQGYLSPKTDYEKKGDELSKDVALMMLPGSGSYGFWRNLGIPIAGALAKEGLEQSGVQENGDLAKYGLMLGLDLLTHRKAMGGGAKEYAGELFQKFESEVANGGAIDVSKLSESLGKLEADLSKGGSRPSTVEALKKVKELKDMASKGYMDVTEAYPFRSAINEIIDSMGGFEIGGIPKHIKQRAANQLQRVKGEVISSVEDWAAKNNPEALKTWKNANEAYSVTEQSNKILNYIKKTGKNFLKDPFIKGLFGTGLGAGGALFPKAIVGGGAAGLGTLAAGTAALKGMSLLTRVVKSPVLREHYGNILKAASKSDAPLLMRSLRDLRDGLQEEPHQNSSMSK